MGTGLTGFPRLLRWILLRKDLRHRRKRRRVCVTCKAEILSWQTVKIATQCLFHSGIDDLLLDGAELLNLSHYRNLLVLSILLGHIEGQRRAGGSLIVRYPDRGRRMLSVLW